MLTVFSMLSGFLFVFLFSSWTSPIFKGSYGYDSAFFSMVGRAILEGKVMYRDYFDVKGPVFFFWEAFGQLLHRDRVGVFILQCITEVSAAYFLNKICRLYKITFLQQTFVFFAVYFVYATTLWGGNCVEEYCLPLNLACIYTGLLYLKGKKKSLEPALLFGITFGICLLSKITVAAPMSAMVLVIAGYLIRNKKIKGLLQCIGLFLAGVIIVALPVIVYYFTRGALKEMYECAFQIAFKRGTDYYESFSIKWELYLTSCYVGIVYWFFRFWGKKRDCVEKWVLLALIVIIFFAMHLGTPFDYYFTTTLPLVAYIAILHFTDVNSIKKDIADIYDEKAAIDSEYEIIDEAVSEKEIDSIADIDVIDDEEDVIEVLDDKPAPSVAKDKKGRKNRTKAEKANEKKAVTTKSMAKNGNAQPVSDMVSDDDIEDEGVDEVILREEALRNAKAESLKVLRRKMIWIHVAFAGIFIIFGAYMEKTRDKIKSNWEIYHDESEYKYYEACKNTYDLIPEDEKDDLYCIESGMIFYEVNQILPQGRYPVNMPYFCELYPPAEGEILDTLYNHTPKWLVADRMDEVDNDRIKEAVYQKYEMVDENSMQQLWKRIDMTE